MNYMKSFTSLCIIALLSVSQMAIPQAGIAGTTFAAGSLMSGIISDLKDAASELIDQLDDRVSARTFQMRNDLIFLQNELASSADQLVGKTFDQLSDQQQTFFESTSYKISEINKVISTTDEEIDSLASQIEQIVAQFPFVGEEPRIRRSSPSYILSEDSNLLITLEGSFLNHGQAELKFGEDLCQITQQNDSKLSFSCISTMLENNSPEVAHKSGLLVLSGEMSFLEKITGFFGSATPTKQYIVPMNIIPEKLGAYKVTAFVLEDQTETKSRTGSWGQSNPHCRGKVNKTANFSPTSGWEIDVSSIKTTETCGRGKQGHAKRNVTSTGFQVESWASNSGTCSKLLGKVITKDARGCSAGTVKWEDVRAVPVRVSKQIKSGHLSWGASESAVLPENLEGFIVTIEPLGKPPIEFNEAIPNKWIDIKRDSRSTSLVLSATTLAKALQ